ncbi:hypothetical protein HPB50_028347 [Hyalomma asiaticum]|nr:hypothetical protein HPB50_028347 [Hyalomma asiaticum]
MRQLAGTDWLTKVNKLRVARTSPGCALPNPPGDKVGPDQPPRINNGQPSAAPARKMPTEPTLRQRGRLLAKNSVASKQPRLPSDALKLIVRPRGGLLLSKISTYQLLEAVCIVAHFTRDAVRHEDLIQANLIQNTFAYCTPDIERAERVLRIKAITIDNKDCEVSVYCAPDDSSGRGVIRGVDLRLDQDTIQAELLDNRNPPIADFRRLGNTTAVLITFAQPEVPIWINFCNKHFTGDSRCKEIYRIQIQIQRRQWEKHRQAEEHRIKIQEPAKQGTIQHTSRWDRQRSGSRQRQPRTPRTPFHRSSLPLIGGDHGLLPGTDPGRLQSSRSLKLLLLLCGIHRCHRHLRPSNKSINNRVEALEKRSASHTPSPPIPQLPATVEPMDVAPPSVPTHKRKAPTSNDPKAEDWQTRLDRLEKKYELTHTDIKALEAHIERSLHTIGSQVSQQIETLSKTIEAQGKSLAVVEPILPSLIMAISLANTTIWQWNCRGFARKRPVLQQFLTASDRPELIALQEGSKNTHLAGFSSYRSERVKPQVAILVKRDLTVLQHNLDPTLPEHVLLEVLPRASRNRRTSLFVLNVYNPPRARKDVFGPLFLKAQELAQGRPLLIVGDFNAHHRAWGYHYDSVKG